MYVLWKKAFKTYRRSQSYTFLLQYVPGTWSPVQIPFSFLNWTKRNAFGFYHQTKIISNSFQSLKWIFGFLSETTLWSLFRNWYISYLSFASVRFKNLYVNRNEKLLLLGVRLSCGCWANLNNASVILMEELSL